MFRQFLEHTFPVVNLFDKSIRLKINNDCQLSCLYCHREGSKHSSSFTFLPNDINKIVSLSKELRRNKIHITGGEPTLNKDIIKIIKEFRKNDLNISITTNGIIRKPVLEELIDSGVNSFTISIHTIKPEDFIQYHRKKITYNQAEQWIEQIFYNIEFLLANNFSPEINMIVSDKLSQNELMDKCFNQLSLKINLLSTVDSSYKNTSEKIKLIKQYNLKPYQYVRLLNCSRAKYDFIDDRDNIISFKVLENYYLNSLCNDCERKIFCDEKYYGIRIEKQKNKILIRPCLLKKILIPIEDFNKTHIGKEILKQQEYATEN